MKEFILILLGVCFPIFTTASNSFTNTWSVKTFEGEEAARNIAQRYGLSFQEKAISFDDYYIFKLDTLESPTSVNMANLTKRLMEHEEIMWAGQLRFKPVSYGPSGDQGGESDSEEGAATTLHRSYRASPPRRNTGLREQSTLPAIGYSSRGPTINIGLSSEKTSAYDLHFTDPFWRNQWYAQDYRTAPGPVMDHNLVPVYRSRDSSGRPITGQGVTVAILDEGVDANHPDLRASLNPRLSFNFFSYRPGFSGGQSHGTATAGVVAMAANNGVCGVGVAYGATIAGSLKMFGGPEDGTDYTYGAALGFAKESIDIYSSSWNRRSLGQILVRNSQMERAAIQTGVSKGRRNMGNIYVFSSGNFKSVDISCAFQELANMKEIILVGSASSNGKVTSYSQACPNVFVATYSGEKGKEGVVSALPSGQCTLKFEGTSASVPIASGIIALVLQANPRLGYRDIQHLITMSAEVAPLANNPNTWQKNKAGFWVSQDFGFGLMNAQNMVNLARNWINVKQEVTCHGVYHFNPPRQFTSTQPYSLRLSIDACENTNSAITFLERVTLTIDINYPGRRGDLSISLASPRGPDGRVTETVLIQTRPHDNSRIGFNRWNVTSVQTWGENPKGDWIVTIRNIHNKNVPVAESSKSGGKEKHTTTSQGIIGTITSFKLTLHGLASRPAHMANGPRINYSGFNLG